MARFNVTESMATGEWRIAPWVYDSRQYAVYAPNGVAVFVGTKRAAEGELESWIEKTMKTEAL